MEVGLRFGGAVGWRSDGGRMAVGWRSDGGRMAVGWRFGDQIN